MSDDQSADISGDHDPKIIVDDDWKSQVQREKEELQKQAETERESDLQLPPASMAMLITTLSTQAMSAMGFIPDPATGKANPNRPMAKHFIDTLGILEDKTAGNLTDDEKHLLSDTLHQLRMAFVQMPPAAAPTGDADDEQKSPIELA